MICTTCATLNIMSYQTYLRLLPSFSHLIRFRGNSPAFQRKIRVRHPRRTRKKRSCCPWNTPSSPETSLSRYRPLIDNPFRSLPSRGQVHFCFLGLLVTSFGFSRIWTWRHPNISPDSSPDTRPSNSYSELTAIWASAKPLFNQPTLLPPNKSGTPVRTYWYQLNAFIPYLFLST